jgi:hypothetical protein
MLFAYFLNLSWLIRIAFIGFAGCFAVFASMWAILRIKHASQSNYKVPAKPWKDQVW